MARTPDPYAAFRLNLEQQRKRAKDLLHAARAGDAAARERVDQASGGHLVAGPALKLTDAQFVIARELGLASWRDLRSHAAALAAARGAIDAAHAAPDAQPRTLHVRCGSDIQQELLRAGFRGDFLSLWDPLVVGPLTQDANWLEQRATFLSSTDEGPIDVPFEDLLAELSEAEARLNASAGEYTRVVIWMEHDSHDQLSLVRILAKYASEPPPILELVSINHFPGSRRFIGLGQLPPEALRMLWRRRQPVGSEGLQFAASAWNALTAETPILLAAVARAGTPTLPDAARALRRHLQELPSVLNGMSLTQSLTLQMLGEQPATVGELFRKLHAEREPLPFLGDTTYLQIVRDMRRVARPPFDVMPGDPGRPFDDRLQITPSGRAVLSGTTDWMSLNPPVRWVGGVRVDPALPVWRWDAPREDVVRS